MNKTLDPIVYWKLRAICGDTQRSLLMVQQAQEAFRIASKKQADIFNELDLEVNGNYQLDDDTLSIFDKEK